MPLPAADPLANWETFYVIVGSSAGALTGLQFVVIALTTESRISQRTEAAVQAFATPTIVHFCSVLLAAAIVSAPWSSLAAPGILLMLCAAGGIAYTAVVIFRAWRLRDYVAVLEDWLWHAAFPIAAYCTELLSAFNLQLHPSGSLYGVGTAMLLLIFTGIHNAWDAAAYITTRPTAATPELPEKAPTP